MSKKSGDRDLALAVVRGALPRGGRGPVVPEAAKEQSQRALQ